MTLDLTLKIDRVENITRDVFQEKYMKPQKPVIIKNFFGEEAPLYSKWSYDFFIDRLGDLEVGIFDDDNIERKDDRSYKSPDFKMQFGDYLNLIQTTPTKKRIFLLNVFKHLPELKNDFHYPDIASNYLKQIPFVFFGGKGAVTRMHQDMDFSNVFLSELTGEKRVILFHPDESDKLYRYPFGVHSSVDPLNPDFEKYPALKYVKGYDVRLKKGETLFMPSGYWHHIEYIESSFGLAIRSLSPNYSQRLRGALNVGLLTHMDEALRWGLQDSWFKTKERIARRRARNAINNYQLPVLQ